MIHCKTQMLVGGVQSPLGSMTKPVLSSGCTFEMFRKSWWWIPLGRECKWKFSPSCKFPLFWPFSNNLFRPPCHINCESTGAFQLWKPTGKCLSLYDRVFSLFFGQHRICKIAGFLSFWQILGLSLGKSLSFGEIFSFFGQKRQYLGKNLSFFLKVGLKLPVSWVLRRKFLEFSRNFPWVWVFCPLSFWSNGEKNPCFMMWQRFVFWVYAKMQCLPYSLF